MADEDGGRGKESGLAAIEAVRSLLTSFASDGTFHAPSTSIGEYLDNLDALGRYQLLSLAAVSVRFASHVTGTPESVLLDELAADFTK